MPGILLAAFVLPTGIHSNFALAYLVLAGSLNAFVFAGFIYWVWSLKNKFYKVRK